MTQQLPAPIATYLAAEAAQDPDILARCFTADALVHDEHHDYRGIDAIIAWKHAAHAKYQYTMEPLDATAEGAVVRLRARLAGNFPGSPVEVTQTFTLVGDRIATLSIE